MYFRRKTSGGRAYLQIVESRREGDQVRQQVVATIGRMDELRGSGELERLLRSGARFAVNAMVLSGAEDAVKVAVRRIGPALVFERLWKETGCRAVLSDLAGARGHAFALERAAFLAVLHRLFVGGCERAAARWREDCAITGVQGLDPHHLDRAMAWLGEELPAEDQGGRTPFARCVKDVVEERLFAHRRDRFTRLDLVYLNIIGLSAGGTDGGGIGRDRYSKDRRPGLRQMILAVLIDRDGRAVCSRLWPGKTCDVTTLIPVIDGLRWGFDIVRICVIADRTMITAETMAELEARGLPYILSVRERSDKLLRELVLDNRMPTTPLVTTAGRDEVEYEAKTTRLAGRRYIVCRNHAQAATDAADRALILAALEQRLARCDNALVGHTGYRRYLKAVRSDQFTIDPDKVEEDKRFDGISVLRTNTDLNPRDAMLCYEQLWTTEQTFRAGKHLFSAQSTLHERDATIRGQVFCNFLALVLKKALEDRIAMLGRRGSWPEIIADLDSLTETEVEQDGKRFIVRSAPRSAAGLAIRATGVALPPSVRQAD
jgi:hypothetical protein